MNWKELKDAVEKQGVKDGDEIYMIDLSGSFTDNRYVKADFDEDINEWSIYAMEHLQNHGGNLHHPVPGNINVVVRVGGRLFRCV